MSLRECMAAHTHREYLMWMAWRQLEWNRPSRTDHYLMQIALEVRRVLAKRPAMYKLMQFIIDFTFPNLTKTEEAEPSGFKTPQLTTDPVKIAAAKAAWGVMLGAKNDRD